MEVTKVMEVMQAEGEMLSDLHHLRHPHHLHH
jgi:hypothetical protein